VSPSLAILIPTYGRAGWLEKLLRRVAAEIGSGAGAGSAAADVTVLVSDNASPDHTAQMVRELQREFPSLDLRLHVQEENLGPVGNVRWLVENAPGTDYVWPFGDDDEPAPGAIAYVLDLLERLGPAVLHLPHRFGTDESHVESPRPPELELFATSREMLVRYHHWLSFLSASVVRREAMVEAVRDAPTDSPWGPYIWFMLAGRRGACAVAPELLVHGGPDICWRDSFREYVTTGVTDAYDEGFALLVDERTFARVLDGWYGSFGADYWGAVPVDELTTVVERFPASAPLRWQLWESARRDARRDAVVVLDAAARAAGCDEASDRLVIDGEQRYVEGDFDGARQAFLAAIRERPTHVEAWCDLGVAMHALSDPRAAEAFDCALTIDPDHPDALLNRASLRLSLGLAADAVEDATRLLRVDPAHVTARAILSAASAAA
jgi:glycosyltransferase involved in cell wall biosynthesis